VRDWDDVTEQKWRLIHDHVCILNPLEYWLNCAVEDEYPGDYYSAC
jgi:hypothetical protein